MYHPRKVCGGWWERATTKLKIQSHSICAPSHEMRCVQNMLRDSVALRTCCIDILPIHFTRCSHLIEKRFAFLCTAMRSTARSGINEHKNPFARIFHFSFDVVFIARGSQVRITKWAASNRHPNVTAQYTILYEAAARWTMVTVIFGAVMIMLCVDDYWCGDSRPRCWVPSSQRVCDVMMQFTSFALVQFCVVSRKKKLNATRIFHHNDHERAPIDGDTPFSKLTLLLRHTCGSGRGILTHTSSHDTHWKKFVISLSKWIYLKHDRFFHPLAS